MTTIQERLMHHLRFREMEIRYSKITKAYHQTYEWIFRPDSSETKWTNFVQWINSDDPLYWIIGKAGAGKSTLTRFLYDHERTQEAFRL
jgi:polynucleotide 5'-kinase involved in rRNA processing